MLCPAEPVPLPPLRAGSAGAPGLAVLGCSWQALALWVEGTPLFSSPSNVEEQRDLYKWFCVELPVFLEAASNRDAFT